MRTTRYFPAVSCATSSYLKKSDKEIFSTSKCIKKSLRFYNKDWDNYFYHPDVLFSAAHHAKKFPDIRCGLQIDDKACIFVDSGGYQLSSGALSEKSWNNKIALEWSENNGTIFPILDRPVTGSVSEGEIKRCLELSADAAKYYYENRSNSACSILNVLSAKNVPEMERWYRAVSPYEFDGWAHGGTNRNFKATLKGIFFLLKKGEYEKENIKFHHIFGVSRMDAMIYFAAIQKNLNSMGIDVQITFDSSYFQRNLAFGGYFIFPGYTGIQQIYYSNRNKYEHLPDDLGLPCDCPVCSTIPSIKDWLSDPRDFYMLGLEHNLFLMLRYKKSIDSLINMNMPEVFSASFPAEVTKNVRAIYKAFNNLDAAYEIIDREFTTKNTEEDKSSLESFFGE